MLRQELLLLLFEPFLKLILNLLLLILQLLLQIEKAFINIFHLLEFESLQLFLDLLQQFRIFIIETLSIQNHLLQI